MAFVDTCITSTRRPGRVRRHGLQLLVLLGLAGAFMKPATAEALTTEALLDTLQHTAFNYFWLESNPGNGLIRDRSQPGSPASIAAVGFGLSAITVGIDRGWVTHAVGRSRVLLTLQTLWNGPQGSGASGFMGYQGLYYHFLDMNTGFRTWDCELSTIDTALLFAGIIDVRQYFTGVHADEVAIRTLADDIVHRANWEFVRNFSNGIYMGWKPGTGFNGFGLWTGYNEAMIMYILALGSPTHPVAPSGLPNVWSTWTGSYNWGTQYGYTYLIFPPLFGHQYSHCWIDFRNINDAYMTNRGITYFENSRRATLAQQAYSIANPFNRVGYSATLWGITASDTPTGYNARGAPPAQNDDGTIAPTAPAGSIPFAPEIVIPTLHNMFDNYPLLWGPYGFRDAFNLTVNPDWYDPDYIGIDQGPIIMMIENYRTGAIWNRFMGYGDVQTGLQRAGFNAVSAVGDGATGGRPNVVLFQNAPNPAREMTTIRFRLEEPGAVSLVLYDVQGRVIRTLFDGHAGSGDHEVRLDTHDLTAGVYFYRLHGAGASEGRSLIVVR